MGMDGYTQRMRAFFIVCGCLSVMSGSVWATPDVVRYELSLEVGDEDTSLDGVAPLHVLHDGSPALDLDLVDLDVSAVMVDGQPVSFERSAASLTVPMDVTAPPGTLQLVTVVYGGVPTPYEEPWGTWGIVSDVDRLYSVNVTEGARHWFPCRDRLDDKAELRLEVTVPDPWVVAGPGTLLSTIALQGDRTAYVWEANWPITPYLIHFAAGAYEVATTQVGDVPMMTYLMPETAASSGTADWFAHVEPVLSFLTARYGPWPFPKIGFDEITLSGAVEQPSCISVGTSIITVGNPYAHVLAHELSHGYFQGVGTTTTWDDLWLSEGLATYHEALYEEAVSGEAGLQQSMASLATLYRLSAEQLEGFHPVYAAPERFGATVYQKGAWVFHMLRHRLGDMRFDAALTDYLDTYRHANASTADFIARVEESSGEDLQAFAQDWIYGIGYPRLGVTWRSEETEEGFHLALRVRALQDDTWPRFQQELPLALDGDEESMRVTIPLPGGEAWHHYDLSYDVRHVRVDPDEWLLKEVFKEVFPSDGPPRREPLDPVDPQDGEGLDGDGSEDVLSTSDGESGCATGSAPAWPVGIAILWVLLLRGRSRRGWCPR